MKKNRRPAARLSLLAGSIIVGLCVGVQSSLLAQQAPTAAAPLTGSDRALVYEYADQITRLVQNGKVDELAHLSIPDQTPKLRDWTSEYLSQVELQEKQRDKQYADACSKAQEQLKAGHYSKSMESLVLAYRIAKDPDAFLNKTDWVKDMSAKVAARAEELEKNGQWIESLQLYTDLNTLYEISTRYKPDMQRLARRTRLLAVYTPQILYDMRKKLTDAEADKSDTPATKPAEDAAPPTFTDWKDYVEKVTPEMGRRAIENSQENWVENTTYETLVKGGVEALRLFLTTPELQNAFSGLKDANARADFDKALDGVLAMSAGKPLQAGDLGTIFNSLIDASEHSVKLPKEVIVMEFTDGAMEKLDPFTAVIWPHEVPEFEKNMNGKFGGVGIQISLENGVLKVISPLEDTPAYRAGIEAGDLITAIDGKSTVGISVDQAVSSIMGDPGSTVTLKIKRGNKFEKDFPLQRAEINVSSVKGFRRNVKDPTKWDYMLDPENKIGYVRITGFQENTPEELEAAVKELRQQGMRGIVLDLRFNPGGLLQAAVDMCDDFLDLGTIVSTRGRSANARPQAWSADAKSIIPMNMPMIVLVNEYSASASEIFSGAMKDLTRALIVGHRTFGKGSVQNLLSIGNGRRPGGSGLPEAMMKLTMAYYYLPNGESLHRRDGKEKWGVDPDVVVDLTPDQLEDLLKSRRDADIIHAADEVPATAPAASAPATNKEAPAPDTQLETGLLMMRLQLIQSKS